VNLARALAAHADAEDLAQEAFIRAFRGIGRFRGDSTFKTWLYRIALNVIHSHTDHRRRWSKLWGHSVDDPTAGTSRAASRPAGFDDTLARRDAIDRALATLPPDLRVTVTLRDVQGLEYLEIAETLDIPIGTVESRIYRARQMLKPLLAPLLERAATEAVPAGLDDDPRGLSAGERGDRGAPGAPRVRAERRTE
jgi:RNA polymerase sigma-70 factor (ECF subfamily)